MELVMGYAKRFVLPALAAAGLLALAFVPSARPYLTYFHVVCMVASVFVGRSFIRDEDVRGWAIQNGALLAHAALLIANGVLH